MRPQGPAVFRTAWTPMMMAVPHSSCSLELYFFLVNLGDPPLPTALTPGSRETPSPQPWSEPVLWGSSLTSPTPFGARWGLGPDLTGLSQGHCHVRLPGPSMAADPVSPRVSSLGMGLCFLPSCVRCCSPPVYWSLWSYLVFPVPAPLVSTWGEGRACTVNQEFTFTLHGFLGTNHVCISPLHFLYFNKDGYGNCPSGCPKTCFRTG